MYADHIDEYVSLLSKPILLLYCQYCDVLLKEKLSKSASTKFADFKRSVVLNSVSTKFADFKDHKNYEMF